MSAIQALELGCDEAEHRHEPVLSIATGPISHAWLHSRCWPNWHASRNAEAAATLSAFEINKTRTLP